MGKRISKYEYQLNGPDGLMKPIIFCYTDENLEKNAIALNILIAEKLVNIKPARRSFKLPGIIDDCFGNADAGSTGGFKCKPVWQKKRNDGMPWTGKPV